MPRQGSANDQETLGVHADVDCDRQDQHRNVRGPEAFGYEQQWCHRAEQDHFPIQRRVVAEQFVLQCLIFGGGTTVPGGEQFKHVDVGPDQRQYEQQFAQIVEMHLGDVLLEVHVFPQHEHHRDDAGGAGINRAHNKIGCKYGLVQ